MEFVQQPECNVLTTSIEPITRISPHTHTQSTTLGVRLCCLKINWIINRLKSDHGFGLLSDRLKCIARYIYFGAYFNVNVASIVRNGKNMLQNSIKSTTHTHNRHNERNFWITCFEIKIKRLYWVVSSVIESHICKTSTPEYNDKTSGEYEWKKTNWKNPVHLSGMCVYGVPYVSKCKSGFGMHFRFEMARNITMTQCNWNWNGMEQTLNQTFAALLTILDHLVLKLKILAANM